MPTVFCFFVFVFVFVVSVVVVVVVVVVVSLSVVSSLSVAVISGGVVSSFPRFPLAEPRPAIVDQWAFEVGSLTAGFTRADSAQHSQWEIAMGWGGGGLRGPGDHLAPPALAATTTTTTTTRATTKWRPSQGGST